MREMKRCHHSTKMKKDYERERIKTKMEKDEEWKRE